MESLLSTRGGLISGASSTRGRRETAREEAGLALRFPLAVTVSHNFFVFDNLDSFEVYC